MSQRYVKQTIGSAVACFAIVRFGIASDPGRSTDAPKYLVKMEFAADPAGTGGKIQSSVFLEVTKGRDGKDHFRVIDPNERLKAGRNIEYRVVHINPFRFNAKGENSTTPFKNEFSEAALAILKGTASESPKKAPPEEPPSKSGKKPEEPVKAPDVKPSPNAASNEKPGKSNLWQYVPPEPSGFDPNAFAAEHFDLKQLEGLSVDRLQSKRSDAQSDADKLVRLSARVRNWAAASKALTENYFAYVSKIDVEVHKAHMNEDQAPHFTEQDFTDKLKPVQASAKKVAEIGSLGPQMVSISRTEIDPRPQSDRDKGDSDARTHAVLEDMRKRADAQLKSTLGSEDVAQIEIQLKSNRDSFNQGVADLQEALKNDTDDLDAKAKEADDRLDKFAKAESELGKRKERLIQEIVDKPGPIVLSSPIDLFDVLRAVNVRLELNDVRGEMDVYEKWSSDCTTAKKKIQRIIENDKSVKEAVEKLKKDFDAAAPDVDKGVAKARSRYGEITTTDFEITAYSKMTTEGTADAKISLFQIGDDSTEKQMGEDYKLSFEVYSPSVVRIVETSVAYVFSTIKKNEFYTHGEPDPNDSSRTIQVVRRRPRDQFGTNLALFLTVPFDPRGTSSMGASFGFNPTDQFYYFGLSYLHGRTQGVTLTAGAVLGREDVLDHQKLNQPLPPGDSEVKTRSVNKTGIFFAIGFRIKT